MTSISPFFARSILVETLSLKKVFEFMIGDPLAKTVVKPHDCLIGQGDLRDQNDGLFSLRQRSCDKLHIDFRLTASRNTMQKVGLLADGFSSVPRQCPLRFAGQHLRL